MNKIEESITKYYGPRCDEVYPGCPVCDAWAEYDALKGDIGIPITGNEGVNVCANGFRCPEGPHGVCCCDTLAAKG